MAGLLMLLLPMTGCIPTISKISELQALEGRMRESENRHRGELMQIEDRVRQLENRNQYLEGLLAGLGSGGTLPAPSRAAATTDGAAPRFGTLPPPPAASTRRKIDPKRFGGTYRLAIATDPPKLDPAHLQDTTSHAVGAQMLEGLVQFDADLNVVPCIAEGWDVGGDGKTYTFRIRKGVKFHHGREVTAGDFVYSFGRILDPKTLSTRTWLFDSILGYPLFQAYRRVGDALRKQVGGEEWKAEDYAEHKELLAGADLARLKGLGHPRPQEAATLAAELVKFLEEPGDCGDCAGRLQGKVEALSSWDFLREGLSAPDDHTFRVRLAKPFAPFVSVLAMVNAAVVPKEKVEELGSRFAFEPVGAGPFRFVRWDHDVVVELEAFDGYFGGRPYLDKLTFRVIPDDVTRLTEFKVGNLESVNRIPDEKYPAIKADPDYPGVLVEKPTLSVFYIAMNVEKPPFDDVRVRRAFNHLVNPEPIIEKIRKGRGEVAVGPVPPSMPGYDPELEGYEYSVEKAKALLAEAGYEDPSELGIVDFWFNSSNPQDVNSKIASVFQQYARDAGITLRLNPVEWGTYLDMVDRGDPEILRLAWIGDYPDADNFLYVLFHSSAIGQGNASRYSDPEVDAWLEEAREGSEQAKRLELYKKAQRKIVGDAAWIPIYHQTDAFLHKPYVKGAVLTGRGPDAIRYKGVWLDKAAREAAEK